MLENDLSAPNYSWCYKTLLSLMEDPSTHDVTFKTSDGGSVSAHRVIVAAGSPVFHAMLYGNMKESSQREIELPNIDSNMLKSLFRYLYCGHIQTSLTDCLELLQAADYFNVSELKTTCHEMIEREMAFSFEFNNFICFNVTIYAVKHHLDSLVEACLNLMENSAASVIQTSWFTSLPLSVLTMFVKSPNLEVRKLNLFLAIDEWYKQQKDTVSSDEIKSLFQQIRYPLIQKNDLIKKVHPTNMADPDLYKAALEYHETDKFDGPEEQLKLRKFYFDFKPMGKDDDIEIKHTNKGTLITNNGPVAFVTCVTRILFTDSFKIPFTFCLKSCSDKHNTLVKLYVSNDFGCPESNVVKLPIGEELQGVISHEGEYVEAHIGDVKLSEHSCGEFYQFSIKLYIGDQIHILRT